MRPLKLPLIECHPFTLFDVVAESSRSVANCGAWLRRKSISDEPQSHAPKPMLRDTGRLRRKKAQSRRQSKQVELEPKLNAFLDTPNSGVRWLRRTTRQKKRNLRVVKKKATAFSSASNSGVEIKIDGAQSRNRKGKTGMAGYPPRFGHRLDLQPNRTGRGVRLCSDVVATSRVAW